MPLSSANIISRATPFLINQKHISVYQALSFRIGYQASMYAAGVRAILVSVSTGGSA